MRAKKSVMICIPSGDGQMCAGLADLLYQAGNLSADPRHPFMYTRNVKVGFRPVEYVRNLFVLDFLADPTFDRLLFIDADMEPPKNWWKLLEHDVPAVSGLTFGWESGACGKREPRVLSVQYRDDAAGGYVSVEPRLGAPYTVDATGAACLALNRRILTDVGRPWFRTDYGELGEIVLGEDCWFFKRANAKGHRVLVDPSVMYDHQKNMNIGDVIVYRGHARAEVARGAQSQVA
jgi:hypothetical protein